MDKWREEATEILNTYRELAYNAWTYLRDVYKYDDILNMPVPYLLSLLKYFTPKIKEMSEARASKELTDALTGKGGVI